MRTRTLVRLVEVAGHGTERPEMVEARKFLEESR